MFSGLCSDLMSALVTTFPIYSGVYLNSQDLTFVPDPSMSFICKLFGKIWYLLCLLLKKSSSYAIGAYIQVGIPIAAGMLLPVTGTMLTPSIAGALMGLSSIGVMANSLLLRFKFSSKQKQINGSYANAKSPFGP